MRERGRGRWVCFREEGTSVGVRNIVGSTPAQPVMYEDALPRAGCCVSSQLSFGSSIAIIFRLKIIS